MALRIWLPLNGNLNNQGLSNLTFSNTNTTNLTINNTGKIGSCYQRVTKQTAGYITSNKTILLDNNITMCCWALVSDGIASANGLITNHNHSTNTGVGLTFKYISSTDFRISCNTGTGSGRTYDTYYGTTNIKDAWHHLALTYDKTAKQLLLYVDGTIEYTLNNYTNAAQADYFRLFEWSTNYDNNNYRPAVKLNDVRVYDESLSPKQIKEISKGLIAHYKFEGIGANPNLAKNTNTANLSTNTCYQHFQTGGSTREIEYDEYGIPCVKITRDDVTQSGWQYLSYDNFDRTAIKTSTTYTVSMDIKASVSGTISLTGLVNGNATNYMTNSSTTINGTVNANQWNHLVFTCTTIADFSSIATTAQVIYWSTSATLRGTGVILWIKNVKLEEGNKNTSWVPNVADTAYTALGYDNMIARDCGGNSYNGTVSGALSYSVDSPRYSGSTALTNAYISSPAGSVLAKSKDFTINGWFYHTSGTNYYASAESYNTSVCLENGRFFVYPASGSAYVGTWSATNNVWQMLTLVHNSTAKTLTLYVNGVQTAQITTNGTIYPNETLNIGGRQNAAGYTGSMSDFRIYATALTADDILTLYKTSGIIDNKGNVYAYEFKEE